MVPFLHVWALGYFTDAARTLGRTEDAARYQAMRQAVIDTCERELWDGDWYLRGITAGERKIGTRADEEGRVHLESNVWAVLSGAAGRARGIKAMDAVDRYLYTGFGLRLDTPSCTVPDDAIGFITRVYPGVKENGSIFSHSNPWAWCAEAVLGRGSRQSIAEQFQLNLQLGADRVESAVEASRPPSYDPELRGRAAVDRGVLMAGFRTYPWLLGAMALSLLLGFTFRFFRQKISRPIQALMEGAAHIRQGELGFQIGAGTGSREFQYLTDSFNRMSGQLRRQFDRLYQEELARRDAQIKALQAQINPHFLNNTLEIINWQARTTPGTSSLPTARPSRPRAAPPSPAPCLRFPATGSNSA